MVAVCLHINYNCCRQKEVLKLYMLKDNYLVTNRKVRLQLGNNSLVAPKAMPHRTMLDEETTKPFSDASTTFFSRPYVVKSIPSWTIMWVVQEVVSAK